MRIEIKNNQSQRQRIYLEPKIILRYFLTDDDKLNTLILCKPDNLELYTTDLGLYEALCSIKPYDISNQVNKSVSELGLSITKPQKFLRTFVGEYTFKLNKLVKFLESVDVLSYKKETGKDKVIVTHEKVEELRKEALKN